MSTPPTGCEDATAATATSATRPAAIAGGLAGTSIPPEEARAPGPTRRRVPRAHGDDGRRGTSALADRVGGGRSVAGSSHRGKAGRSGRASHSTFRARSGAARRRESRATIPANTVADPPHEEHQIKEQAADAGTTPTAGPTGAEAAERRWRYDRRSRITSATRSARPVRSARPASSGRERALSRKSESVSAGGQIGRSRSPGRGGKAAVPISEAVRPAAHGPRLHRARRARRRPRRAEARLASVDGGLHGGGAGADRRRGPGSARALQKLHRATLYADRPSHASGQRGRGQSSSGSHPPRVDRERGPALEAVRAGVEGDPEDPERENGINNQPRRRAI